MNIEDDFTNTLEEIYLNRECIGKKWGELKKEDKKSLSEKAYVDDSYSIDSNIDCIVDFYEQDLAVAGKLEICGDGSQEIVINDEAIIYNPTL